MKSTNETKVVNIRTDPYDVYCGRAGKGQDGYFGNPFSGSNRWENIDRFEEYFYNRLETDPEYKKRVLALKGKRLGCFCIPKDCHVDIIKEYLDKQ